MSLDRSLKGANALVRHRNVLKRGERLDKLKELEKWDDSKSPLGIPKVAHRKMALAKAEKTEAAEGDAAATPAAGGAKPAGAKAAAPAAGAKGAAPAAGAKGAAPAAKAAAPAAKKK
jgi:small basic protein (TIGR04137 family)